MLKLKVIPSPMSVCKVHSYNGVDFTRDFVFTGKTDEELSLVCPTEMLTSSSNITTTDREDGWRMFRIEGTLDFALIGILSKISTILAENKIGIFALSTFNTDYIMTKEENFEKALEVLEANGSYTVVR